MKTSSETPPGRPSSTEYLTRVIIGSSQYDLSGVCATRWGVNDREKGCLSVAIETLLAAASDSSGRRPGRIEHKKRFSPLLPPHSGYIASANGFKKNLLRQFPRFSAKSAVEVFHLGPQPRGVRSAP